VAAVSLWHRHRWAETSRCFNPPTIKLTNWSGPHDADLISTIMYGITVIELRCEECGDVKAVRYAGWAGLPDD
jgi:hypothetical protein